MMKRFNFNISAKMMVIVFALSILFISCKKNKDEVIVYGNAKFKLVNAVQGSTDQDFYQGDSKISTTAVAYGQVSDYLTVKAGASVVSFKSAGTQNVNATESIATNTDMNYTVFYIKDNAGTGKIYGYPESNATPPTGKAGVRFVNLGVGLTSSVLVSFATGEPLTTDLAFGKITNYAVLDPATELKFSMVGTVTSSTSIPAATFQTGKLYTVWFDATSTTAVQYHVVLQN